MKKIIVLPPEISQKIAAGEVIERPFSVVKELVENSLDANASEIKVELLSGGKKLVRVTDNGHGMRREDAKLCFERHSTSKIQSVEDISLISLKPWLINSFIRARSSLLSRLTLLPLTLGIIQKVHRKLHPS